MFMPCAAEIHVVYTHERTCQPCLDGVTTSLPLTLRLLNVVRRSAMVTTVNHDCEHEFDDHIVIATTSDPLDGGVIICQVKGCLCTQTWGVNTTPARHVPGPQELDALRQRLQTEEP
jgi:hypothetical protein